MQRVLSVGYPVAPFKQRNAVLSAAGLTVREAVGAVQALGMIKDELFDVVVLGSALSGDDRDLISKTMRQRRRLAKIIMLYDGRITGTEMADAIIADDDPQRVIDTIRLLTENGGDHSECA